MHMKKLIIIAAAVFMLVSCGNTGEKAKQGKVDNYLIDPMFDTEDYLPGYDVERGLCSTKSGFCENEYTYYALPTSDFKLHYSDKKTGIGGLLCSKLQCSHTDENCDAASILPTVSSLRIYDGKLYWAALDSNGDAYLYSADSDGTNRAIVRQVPVERVTAMNSCPTFAVHRGYAYYSCITDEVVDGKAYQIVVISADELKKSGESIEIMNTRYDCDVNLCTQLYANKMYIAVTTRNRENMDEYGIELYIWDSKTRTMETAAAVEFSGFVKSLWVIPREGIYLAKNCNGPAEIYWFDFKTKELTLKLDFSEYVKNNCAALGDGVAVLSVRDGESIILSVKDMNGNELLSKTATVPSIEGEWAGYSVVGVGREALIMCISCFEDTDMKEYFVAFSLETGEAMVLW